MMAMQRVRERQVTGEPPLDLEELVELARLAPSTHNTQPWRFRVGPGRIDVYAAEERWLPVADEDRRELHLSLGCAIETLAIAAEHMGWQPTIDFFPRPGRAVMTATVRLHRRTGERPMRAPSLFHAIARRQTTHRPFDGYPVAPAALELLRDCVDDEGVALITTSERPLLDAVGELVERAERVTLSDPGFRREQAHWLSRGGVGQFGAPLPVRALARFALRHLHIGGRIARKHRTRIASSGALAVIVTLTDDPESRVRAGQAMQRVWLLATTLGLSVQPVSAPLRVPRLRRSLGSLIGATHMCPQILLRIGHAAPELHRPPRLDRRAIVAD